MNFLATSLNNIGLGDAGILAFLGYALVFVGLIALMVVVMLIGRAFSQKKAAAPAKAPAAQAVATPAPAAPETPAGPVAPGSAGHLKIYNVPPKTAAMLMAIVADKMGKPLNELRFISIKEVK